MAYVIRRHGDGKYVAKPGSTRSYTASIAAARVWPTSEAAMAERCDNETVVAITGAWDR